MSQAQSHGALPDLPMRALFAPASVTVVGGGNDLTKPGGQVVHRIRNGGHPALSVVNPKSGSVQDCPTFRSIEELPEAPELAIVSVPAPLVLESVKALLARGTRAFVVLSCGFSELDETGRALEHELVRTVADAGGVVVGPNSMGVLTPHYWGIFGGPTFEPASGTIAFVSASGSTAAFVMEAGLVRGLRFDSLVSVGNSAMVGVEDVLGFHAERFADSPVKLELLYLESIHDPAAVLRHARALRAKGCHIVALKAGTTEVGARAASSHTGAMATRDAAVSALFDKAGVVRVGTKSEMVDVAGLLSCYGPPRSRNIAIVTHAGGPGIMLADELTRQGFRVPVLSPRVQERLAAALAPGSATGNPIDFLASGNAEHLRAILQILHEDAMDEIGAVAVIYGSPGLFDIWPVLREIIDANGRMSVPVYPILPSVRTAAREAEQFRDAGYYYFTDEVALAVALGLVARTPAPAAVDPSLPSIDEPAVARVLARARADGRRELRAPEVEQVLAAVGLAPPPSRFVADAAQAVAAAEELGFPVVLKVVGPSHKSDVGGVVVDVRTPVQVADAVGKLLAIESASGVMVQKQVSGLELILGVSREASFGHLVLFGLGGIFTEALRDVTTALAPIGPVEAARMIESIRAQKLLDGWRGLPPIDREAVGRALCALGALVHRFPEIAELDVNPLLARGAELWAVDGRIALTESAAGSGH